ncbi:MAG: DUF2157 domain-containing protein [Gammaproteobacteria bacterium]|jgi:hypothetical protein
MMHLNRKTFEKAAASEGLSAEQTARLWQRLVAGSGAAPAFRAAHILYYLGGFVAISAISLFVTMAWDTWSGWPMLILALCLAMAGTALAEKFLSQGHRIPAGIAVTFAVATVPLVIYSLQHILGFWTGRSHAPDFHRYVDWRWYFMEMGTLATAAVALWRYRLPFIMFVVAVVFWYLSMDLVPLIDGGRGTWESYWELRRLVTVIMGVLTLLLAFWIDVRSGRQEDFSFWLYIVGVMMLWGGVTATSSHSEWHRLLYAVFNLGLIVVGAILMRRVFAVFGAIGLLLYLGHLARLFATSLMFPVVLAVIGLAIIYAGIWWQKNEHALHARLVRLLPGPIRNLIEQIHDQDVNRMD